MPSNRLKSVVRLSILLCLPLAFGVGCISPMTEPELKSELRRTAKSIPNAPRAQRVVPIHADTKMAAWAMLSDASNSPETSPMSRRLAEGFSLGNRREVLFVVGGPYPKLVDRVLVNAFEFNEGKKLSGLKLVVVSPDPPSQKLKQVAQRAGARLEFRPLP